MNTQRTLEGRVKIVQYEGDGYYLDTPTELHVFPQVLDDYEGKRVRVTVMVQDLDDETLPDFGEVSDGVHTFNELYEFRRLYNAGLFNSWAFYDYSGPVEDVHKSRLHPNGKAPFDDPNLFVVQAQLPTGQISNHYEMQHWDLFQIPERDRATEWDGHTAADVADRLRRFLRWDY